MRRAIAVLVIIMPACALTACASAPERNFQQDYQPVWGDDVAGVPGGPHVVYDLPGQNRLMVRRSFGAGLNAAFSAPALLGLSDGKPGMPELQQAAQAYLAQKRGACEILDAAKSTTSSNHEFRYRCAGPAQR